MSPSDPVRQRTLSEWLDAISASDPTPGGGSVAAVVGAMTAALGMMVAAVVAKRSGVEGLDELHRKFHLHREKLVALSAADEQAFDTVIASYRIPKDDPVRPERIESALRDAAEVPLATMRQCVELMRDLETLSPHATDAIASDISVAAALALAVVESARHNVLVNCRMMKDRAFSLRLRTAQDEVMDSARSLAARISERIGEIAGTLP